jgi:bifunctional UDP-N-acetylglucosamine pyrophosphorylase/glucosamine-1-phosphate N-acetyltransferase
VCSSDLTNYGRILLSENDQVLGIIEEKDASPEQRKIKEINTGIYCIDRHFLFSALQNVGTNNSQKEMYLTDIVAIASSQGIAAEKFTTYNNPKEILGVNSRVELAEASLELQMRRNISLMLSGVTISMPHTVSIAREATVAQDSQIGPLVSISGKSVLGKECTIGQGAVLQDAQIGDNVKIGPYSVIVNASVPTGSNLPPYTSIGGKLQ